MNDLLTTRQVQDILKVDRITIYRMLQDGRLQGVKIGQQWRFPQRAVERLLGAHQPVEDTAPTSAASNFPTHCVQTIQDLFSDVGQTSAFVVDQQGRLQTQISRPLRFAQLLLDTPSGARVAQAAWQQFTLESKSGSKFFSCPFGLQYIGAPIIETSDPVGMFVAGQFYWQPPNPREEAERIQRLAAAHGVTADELALAARDIPVIDPSLHERVESWPFTAARAVMSILHERINFMDRLQQIANLTQIS